MKYIRPTLVLLIICVVISGLLAVTYHFTYVPPLTDPSDIVAAMAEDYSAVLPGSSDYDLIFRTEGYDKLAAGEIVEVTCASNGYIITAHSSGQYDSDPIRVMVGIDENGCVSGVRILKISETPGLGLKTNSPGWLAQFVGGKIFSLDGKSGTAIDGITSATKSSKAIVNAVNMAMEKYAEIAAEVK